MELFSLTVSIAFLLSLFIQGMIAHREKGDFKHILPVLVILFLTFFLVKNGMQVIWSYLFLVVVTIVFYYGIYYNQRMSFLMRKEFDGETNK